MDYFKQLITKAKDFEDTEGVITQFCNDVESYREFSIRHYNGNSERGTDKFCLQMFLNNYNISINVFGLHSNMNHRKFFNRLLNRGWDVYNDIDDNDDEWISCGYQDEVEICDEADPDSEICQRCPKYKQI